MASVTQFGSTGRYPGCRRVWPALVTAAVVGLAGCGAAVHTLSFPAPAAAATPAATTTTSLADPAAIEERGVKGVTTSARVAIGPGSTTISGTVVGPDGTVPGATVLVERLVGAGSASAQVQSAADGSFRIGGILGGRYRVRAWKTPSLAMTTPQIFFVADGATQRLELQPSSFRGPTVRSAFAPDPATAGQPTTVLIEVTVPTVSPNGIVQYAPAVDKRVRLIGAGQWSVLGRGQALTDATGEVSFVAACGHTGDDPLTAVVAGRFPVALSTPICLAAPPPPTAPTTTVAPPASVPPTAVPPTAVPPTPVPPTTVPTTVNPPAPPSTAPPSTAPPTTTPVPTTTTTVPGAPP